MKDESERALIVTLVVEPDAQERWDRERSALFPRFAATVPAHVTLFHALPGALRAEVDAALKQAADRDAFPLRVTGVMPLGRGAAYRVEATELDAVHGLLQQQFRAQLSKQDAQPLRAHATVQNKVDRAEAQATVARLTRDFTAWTTTALGLNLWRYDGGPWTHLRRVDFRRR